MKVCTRCCLLLPLENFGKSSQSLDGKRPDCKTCYNAYMREFYKKNPEQIKTRTAKYFAANRDELNKKRKIARLQNLERELAAGKLWASKNPDKVKAMKAKNRAKRKNAAYYQVTGKDIQRLLSAPCFYCNKSQSEHIDHIIPLVRGGVHSVGNLIGSCQSCNLSKGAKTVMEWRLYRMTFKC